MNKKVVNAKNIIYNNIEFKSKLEVYAYKKLTEEGLDFEYEGTRFILVPSYYLKRTLALYPNASGKNTKELIQRNGSKIQEMKYTPDFIINYKNYFITFETKGNPNDNYPIVRKLALQWLENYNLDERIPVFLEAHNQRQINEVIEFIKQL